MVRTAKEIRQYLRQQRWYKDFLYNTRKSYGKDKKKAKKCLRGYRGSETLLCAFQWYKTPQGQKKWSERALIFRQWYYKKIVFEV